MTFLSHDKIHLINHLEKVAIRAEEIVEYTKFETNQIAYISGLFHDLGKLNPYYQELFTKDSGNEDETKKELAKKYDAFHAPYSQWIAGKLLKSKKLSRQDIQIILMLIYSHHGPKRNTLGKDTSSKKSKNTKQHLIQNWKEFVVMYSDTNEFKEFDMNINLDEREKIHKNGMLEISDKQLYLEEFIKISYLFSALLQADKGSFTDSKPKILDFYINTNMLAKTDTKLGHYRTKFQNHVLESISTNNSPIVIVNAPTGIGKTKAFLDIVNYMQEQLTIERVFYFAPLLALTDDFENKIKQCISKSEEKQFLTYNHIYTGSLDEKNDDENNDLIWNFDQEAFNEKFVVSTMHRLLMTIYSDANSDSIKFASLRNSLLILDEVQTLPKFLLKNLCEVFKIMNDKMNTRIILTSATVPYELSGLDTIRMNERDEKAYIKTREREIIICESLDTKIPHGANLIMVNTRKEAVVKFNEIKSKRDNVFYISSGITKLKQREILERIKSCIETKEDFILISTQVVEAGVDISFTNIWRQMAPLDNIVQMLGRLDRENESSSSRMHIFPAKNNIPYSSLEFDTSKKYLSNISNSSQLYEKLPEYYKEISMMNKTQQDNSEKLEKKINDLDFKEVWSMIRDHLNHDHNESVYIPHLEEWESIRSDLLLNKKRDLKKYNKLVASLPISPYDIKDCFDEKLFEKKILYPKKDKIEFLYDKHIGLDKWKKQ